MDKPEALRLADECDTGHPLADDAIKAAAELRRLHASCEDYAQHKQRQDQRILALCAQRDALLEKIKGVLAAERSEGGGCGGFINKPPTREHQRRAAQAWQELHAAIKAAEEGK